MASQSDLYTSRGQQCLRVGEAMVVGVGFGTRAGRLMVPKVGERLSPPVGCAYTGSLGRDNFADRRRIGLMAFDASVARH